MKHKGPMQHNIAAYAREDVADATRRHPEAEPGGVRGLYLGSTLVPGDTRTASAAAAANRRRWR